MEDLYNTIEQYLRGQMPAQEREAFEARLRDDPALREEVQAFRMATEVLEVGIADGLRADFANWQKEAADPKPARSIPLRVHPGVWAIAASLLFLLGVFAFWRVQQLDSDTLAAHYYDPAGLTGVRSAGAGQGELDAGLAALRAGQLDAAATVFQAFDPASPYYADARYLLANTWYQSGNLDEAVSVLQQLQNHPDPAMSEKSDWLLLLTYLKDGRKESPEFESLKEKIISDPDHSFYPKAVELQEKLDSFWAGWAE